jgi:hypothetical protein
MYDRMIFKGHLTAFYKKDGARCYLWSQGVALKDFTPYAKATTAHIAEHCRALVTSAGRSPNATGCARGSCASSRPSSPA